MRMTHIAIGDIHGCVDELQQLLQELSEYQNDSNVTWVFLGDYVDRGPNVKGVVNTLMDFNTKNNCVFLKGNHEDMMLDPYEQSNWWRNGGSETLRSYENSNGLPNEKDLRFHIDKFFRPLILNYQTEKYFFCHAGVHPHYELDNQLPSDLMWIRQSFLWSDKDFGKIIVHGHTPESLEKPVIKPNRINIDQGCVFGGHLTAVILEGENQPKFKQIQSNFKFGKDRIKKGTAK